MASIVERDKNVATGAFVAARMPFLAREQETYLTKFGAQICTLVMPNLFLRMVPNRGAARRRL
jgi:hypothetical protein